MLRFGRVALVGGWLTRVACKLGNLFNGSAGLMLNTVQY
jgi:hypothetical protein